MPIVFDGWKIPSPSVLESAYQAEMNTIGDLLADADAALRRAKAQG